MLGGRRLAPSPRSIIEHLLTPERTTERGAVRRETTSMKQTTTAVLIYLLVLALGCATDRSVPESATTVDPTVPAYSGHYEFGFELAVFTPCDIDETWWVARGEAASFAPLTSFITRHYAAFHDGTFARGRLFVRWRGTASPPGRYGHRGSHAHQFHVLQVLEVRWPTPDDCHDSSATKDPSTEPTATRRVGSSTVDLPRSATLLHRPATTRGDAE